MNKKEKIAFALVAAIAMTSGGFAFGQSVNNVSSDQVIYACVTGVNGNITKVSNTPKTCPRGTTPLSWNMVGPKGDQGIQGIQGIQGDKGDVGSVEYIPAHYLLGPNGERIRFIFTRLGEFILINDVLYQWDGVEIQADYLSEGWSTSYFKSLDCSGDAFKTSEWGGTILSNLALRDHPSGRFAILEKSSETKISDYKSYVGSEGSCEALSANRLSNVLLNMAQHIDDLSSSAPLRDRNWIRLDFINCKVSISLNGANWEYSFDDCKLSDHDYALLYPQYLNAPLLEKPLTYGDSFGNSNVLKQLAQDLRNLANVEFRFQNQGYKLRYVQKPDISSSNGWHEVIE